VSAVLPFAVACSSYADTSAKQVEKDVKSSMSSLKSVHISGAVTMEGSKIDLDLALDTEGDCTGSIGLGEMGKLELIATGGNSYVKPDAAFWKASGAGALATKVQGKWVSGDKAFGGVTEVCDLDELLKGIKSDDDKYTKVSSTDTKIGGKDVVKVGFTSSNDTKGTLYVLADEPHYVVKADLGKDGSLSFSDFNEAVKPAAPAQDEVIDASKLG
jgi:hypothetical protein